MEEEGCRGDLRRGPRGCEGVAGLLRRELEIGVVAAEECAKGFDDQFVIGALRQARNGGAAYDACSGNG